MMKNSTHIKDGNKIWFCFSIFYAQDGWHIFLPIINNYIMSVSEIYQFCFFLSNERGEHIRIVISSYTSKPDILQESLYQDLEKLIEKNLSHSVTTKSYEQELWAHYPNNIIIKNGFDISQYTAFKFPFHTFAQLTSQIIIDLLDGDNSEESHTSIALYLYTCLSNSPRIDYLYNILKTIQTPTCNEDITEEFNLITSYWESNYYMEFSSNINTLYLWQKERDYIYAILGEQSGFLTLAHSIKEQLSVSNKNHSYALSLLKTWSKSYHYRSKV